MDRFAKGRGAEDIAARYLEREGFRILWRNVRIGALEVDLVAKQEDLVVIVEVRSRGQGRSRGRSPASRGRSGVSSSARRGGSGAVA